MEDNLGLIQLLLNIRNAIHLGGVLISLEIPLQRGERELIVPRGASNLGGRLVGQELVDHLGEDLVGGKLGVVL